MCPCTRVAVPLSEVVSIACACFVLSELDVLTCAVGDSSCSGPDIVELKGLQKPSDIIKLVFDGVMILKMMPVVKVRGDCLIRSLGMSIYVLVCIRLRSRLVHVFVIAVACFKVATRMLDPPLYMHRRPVHLQNIRVARTMPHHTCVACVVCAQVMRQPIMMGTTKLKYQMDFIGDSYALARK